MANLAQMSNLGRFGDNKMRFVDGELSHVNSGEASLIDVLGQQGEDIVQNVGAGTINPQTGKKEYWLPVLFAGIGAGISAYSAWKTDFTYKLMQIDIETLRKSGLATSGTTNRKQSEIWQRISNQYSTGTEGLMANLGQKMGEITSFYEGEKSRLRSEKRKLSREADLSDDMAGSWYLGKNLFG